MNYVDHLNLFGVEAKEIPCIKGTGAPTKATEGAVGCFYMDEDSGTVYKCTAVADGVYIWENIDSTIKNAVLCTEQTLTEAQKTQARENIGTVGADEITEYAEVDGGEVEETVTLFDTTGEDSFENGVISADGTVSTAASYLKTPAIDVSGVASVTVECNNFIPASETTERPLWLAQFDAQGNMLTREYCNLQMYTDGGALMDNFVTANLVVACGENRDSAIGTAIATVTLLEGATTLYLFNLRAGDSLDMTVRCTRMVGTTTQKRMIKTDVLPIGAIDPLLANCAYYVYPLALKVAKAAKAHMTGNSLSLVAYTDTHFIAGDKMVASRVAKLLAELTNSAAILHLGDLTHGVAEDKDAVLDLWQEHNRIVSCGKTPYLQVVGNHDDNNHFNRKQYANGDTTARNAENYITAHDMFVATTQNARWEITVGSKNGWYYLDDEDSKSRIIVLNSHDYPWTVDEDGNLLYDSHANTGADPLDGIYCLYSIEQLEWLVNTAMDFSDKENESEWQIIACAHMGVANWFWVNYIFRNFKSGTKIGPTLNITNEKYNLCNGSITVTTDFSTGGARNILFLLGDRHEDFQEIYGTTDAEKYPAVGFLNASLAKDQVSAPIKTAGTPTETAVSVLVFNPDEGKMYEIRFGAGGTADAPIDPLTNFDNYRVVDYGLPTA